MAVAHLPMSPEQCDGAPADPQCAIFACCLLARTPFAAPTTGETIRRIVTVEPPPVVSWFRAVPGGLDRIVKMILPKDRKVRYTSLSEVVLDVMELAARPLRARLVSAWTGPSALATTSSSPVVIAFGRAPAADQGARSTASQPP